MGLEGSKINQPLMTTKDEIKLVNPTKRALLIAINYVGTNNRLYGCVNDQLDVYYFLQGRGYNKENILFLHDESTNSNGSPTYSNILKGFQWLLSGAKVDQFNNNTYPAGSSNCQYYFSYSGHGSQVRDNNQTETDGMDEFIVPLDYFSKGLRITDDMIREQLVSKIDSGSALTGVMDCCHSGTVFDLRWKVSTDAKKQCHLTYNAKKGETNGNVMMLSACTDRQMAAENYWKNKTYGLLTSTYLHIMESQSNISCNDLLTQLNTRMNGQNPLITFGQNRSLYSSFNI